MPSYSYIVINPENQQLSGTINSTDEKSARAELNQLGFSIISMEAVDIADAAQNQTEKNKLPIGRSILTETVPSESEGVSVNSTEDGRNVAMRPQLVFEFAATDKNQKKVTGTIQAEDRYTGYKRLVKEYSFTVEYIVDSTLPEEQKTPEKQKGVFELQNILDKEEFLGQKKKLGKDIDVRAFESKQAALQQQVNFVLEKVKNLLDTYEADMKPEIKEKTRLHVDKILRIKNSTNLDYIRKTCEELLLFLQKEELFLHEELRIKEHAKMSVEMKRMMMGLAGSNARSIFNFHNAIQQWRQEHILNKTKPTGVEILINSLLGLIGSTSEENPKIFGIKEKIRAVNKQIKQYIILYFQAPSAEFKSEIKTGFTILLKERKKLLIELKIAHKEKKTIKENTKISTRWPAGTLDKLHTFSGWLLALYLLYYFVSLYVKNKQFGLKSVPPGFDIVNSSFLKYFLAILFLFYAVLAVKIVFFSRNNLANLFLSPIFLAGSIMILLNF